MPGPVPSVSTKTRGYVQPPIFHTKGARLFNTSPAHGSYSPVHLNDQPAWQDSLNHQQTDVYVPSYQKKVNENSVNHNRNPRPQQHFTTIQRQSLNYRPSSVQPVGVVHRQFNSPMALYSNDNIQDAMRKQVSHVTHVR